MYIVLLIGLYRAVEDHVHSAFSKLQQFRSAATGGNPAGRPRELSLLATADSVCVIAATVAFNQETFNAYADLL